MSKRKRFIITSLILSAGFIAIQFFSEDYRYLSIAGLTIVTFILLFWSLREGIKFNLSVLSLVLPTMFTLGVGLFWFLLPSSIYTRIPIVLFYGAGIYALCLTSNIFTVSALRTIALFRAARGVGFVLTLITAFFLFDTILSLRTHFYINAIFIFIVSFFLFFQGMWSVQLDEKPNRELMMTSIIPAIVVTQTVISIFFWPVTVVVGSLFLIVVVYVLLGLIQSLREGRLFAQTIREYLTLGILVFIGMLLATHWK